MCPAAARNRHVNILPLRQEEGVLPPSLQGCPSWHPSTQQHRRVLTSTQLSVVPVTRLVKGAQVTPWVPRKAQAPGLQPAANASTQANILQEMVLFPLQMQASGTAQAGWRERRWCWGVFRQYLSGE